MSSEDDSDGEVDIHGWIGNMMKNGYWRDHAFLQLASNYLKKDFVILPINPEDGHNGTDRIIINAKSSIGEPFYFLHYSNVHFQSIRPKLDADGWGGPVDIDSRYNGLLAMKARNNKPNPGVQDHPLTSMRRPTIGRHVI